MIDSLSRRSSLKSVLRESEGDKADVGSFYLNRGRKFYELKNHLDNVLAVVSDVKLGVSTSSVVDYYIADVVEMTDYEPFGMQLAQRHWVSGSGYRFGFNGKESDDEWSGEGNMVDFGARVYYSRLGRWLASDPKESEYTSWSPYNFALCTPNQAIDPDGNLVIFVNGFRKSAYQNWKMWGHQKGFSYAFMHPNEKTGPSWVTRPLFSRSDIFGADGGPYWKFVDDLVMERHNDYNALYVDGGFEPHSNAQERYDRGISDAVSIIQKIRSGEIEMKCNETIKMAGHSHGGWHSIGMADAFSAAGYTVEVTYVKNPHQPDQQVKRIDSRKQYRLVQYSTPSDYVSSGYQWKAAPELIPGTGFGQGWGAQKITDGLMGDSKFARIEGSTEFITLPDRINDNDLGGHNVTDQAENIRDIKKGDEGYVGPKE